MSPGSESKDLGVSGPSPARSANSLNSESSSEVVPFTPAIRQPGKADRNTPPGCKVQPGDGCSYLRRRSLDSGPIFRDFRGISLALPRLSLSSFAFESSLPSLFMFRASEPLFCRAFEFRAPQAILARRLRNCTAVSDLLALRTDRWTSAAPILVRASPNRKAK